MIEACQHLHQKSHGNCLGNLTQLGQQWAVQYCGLHWGEANLGVVSAELIVVALHLVQIGGQQHTAGQLSPRGHQETAGKAVEIDSLHSRMVSWV